MKSSKIKKTNSARVPIVLFIVLAVCSLSGIGFYTFRVTEQRNNANELSNVGEDLMVIYQKLLKLSHGNISQASFQEGCSESSVKLGRGQITCWKNGHIELNKEIDLSSAKNSIDNAVLGNSLSNSDPAVIQQGSYNSGVFLLLSPSTFKDMKCDIRYYQNSLSLKWGYSLGCRKTVPDFLSGYKIIE